MGLLKQASFPSASLRAGWLRTNGRWAARISDWTVIGYRCRVGVHPSPEGPAARGGAAAARWAHNPKVGGSNPPPATRCPPQRQPFERGAVVFCGVGWLKSHLPQRSSMAQHLFVDTARCRDTMSILHSGCRQALTQGAMIRTQMLVIV